MTIIDTLVPYETVDYHGIQYTTCCDYSHISRYRMLRQVIHSPLVTEDRFMALETPNPVKTRCDCIYYDVPPIEENRLDIIANKFLGSSAYSWVIAYFNNIEDGYTVSYGQRLIIPTSVTALFAKGELLAPVSPYALNLYSE